MRIKSVFAVLVLLLSCLELHAQNYLWPTDASRWITSSFAETRPRRMHAAIDIKTWNRTGYKVFAVRDGYIQRIRVSPFGYGKVIYQKLDTGEIAIYAHLDGFNEELEKYVAEQQEKSGRYRIDRYLTANVFPVKQGEVLAYTGETGIGVPHLHFEMRDAQNRPFNPLLKGYPVEDAVAPILTGLAVLPLGYGSRVNDDFRPVRYTLQKTGRNSYRVDEIFTFEGAVGLALKGYDITNEGSNRFHVYRIELSIDGKPHFSIQYDKFSYGQNKFVQLERNFRLERQGFGRYIHLFSDPMNTLNFYRVFNDAQGRLLTPDHFEKAAPNGQLAQSTITPGRHVFTVSAQDFFGNEATLTGEFIAGRWLTFKPEIAAGDSAMLQAIRISPAEKVTGLTIWENNTYSERNWRVRNDFRNDAGSNHLLQRIFPLPLSSASAMPPARAFRFILHGENGVSSWREYFVTATAGNNRDVSVKIQPEFYDDYIRVHIAANMPLTRKPFVEITNGDGSTIYPQIMQKNLTEFVFVIEQRKLQGRDVRVLAQAEGVTGHLAASDVRFENHRIPKNATAELTARDGQIRIAFQRNSLYNDLYGRIELKHRRHELNDAKTVSHVYSAEPKDVPLNNGAVVSLKYPDSLQIDRLQQLGVYYRVGRNRWIFIDNQIDTLRKEVSARVLSLEDFTLRIDDIAPTVIVRAPARNSVLSRYGTVRVYARDRESGFASEESLVLKIDGKRVIAEYDPEHSVVSYTPRQPWAPGTHLLEFTATDRCGNSTVVSQTITVARAGQGR